MSTQDARKEYLLGWKASERFGRSSGSTSTPLERADRRGVSEFWYDGYFDHACDREKFHTLNDKIGQTDYRFTENAESS